MALKKVFFFLFVLLFVSSVSAFLNPINDATTLLNLHFDGNATDMSGKGIKTEAKSGMVYNSTYAIFNNSANSFIEVDNANYKVWNKDYNVTIEFWFKEFVDQNSYFFGHQVTGTPGGRFMFTSTSTSLNLASRIGNYTGPNIPFVLNKWYHVAFTTAFCGYACKTNTYQIFINGVLNQTGVGYNISGTPINLTIGRYISTDINNLSAYMDGFVIYNSTRSAAQILADYNYQSLTNYYVCQNGSDSNDGLDPNRPIKTITRLNDMDFDLNNVNVFFCGNSVWRFPTDEYLDVKSGVSYNKYGSGNKPQFWGSINASSTTNWTDSGGNIWNTTFTISQQVGNIIFNISGSEYTGHREMIYSDVNAQGDFYYDSGTDKVSLYSTSNPATYYSEQGIELATSHTTKEGIVDFDNLNNVKLYNLSVKYGAIHGFSGSDITNSEIKECEAEFIGGAYSSQRYGNAIQFGLGTTNSSVKNNNVSQVFDACYTSQSWASGGAKVIRDVEFSYNFGSYCSYGFEYFQANSTLGNTSNLNVSHNTFTYLGSGYYNNQRTDSVTYSAVRMNSIAERNSLIFKDNIFYNSSGKVIAIGNGGTGIDGANATFDYNLYYGGAVSTIYWRATDYATLALFKVVNGNESHGVQINNSLLFGYNTYIPILGSLACSMSSTGSYVGVLPCSTGLIAILDLSNLGNKSVSNDTITLNWTNPSYTDYNRTDVYRAGTKIGNMTSGFSEFIDSGLTGNTTYRYDLIPYDDYGNYGNNATLTLTTYPTNTTPPSSGTFPVLVSQGVFYVINFTFAQKPYFLSFNLTGNNTNPKVYDYQKIPIAYACDNVDYYNQVYNCANLFDNNDISQADFQHNGYGSTYSNYTNFANYTGDTLNYRYYIGLYGGETILYCYNSSSTWQPLRTITGGGTYVEYDYNGTIPTSCRQNSIIQLKTYSLECGSGTCVTSLFDLGIYSQGNYFINFMDINIFNSTNTSNNTATFSLTGYANNITGNKINITFGSYYENIFNYNVSYALLYNKTIKFNLYNPATSTLTNATCYYNDRNLTRNQTFYVSYNSSLSNILSCVEENVYANTTYTVTTPDDEINVTMLGIYAYACPSVMTAYDAVAYNFSVKDEDNATNVYNNSIYVDMTFGNQVLSFQKLNTNNLALCVQNGQDYTVNGDIRIENGYYTKYFLRSAPYNNATRYVNLYNKPDASLYSDLSMTIRDSAYMQMEGIIAKLERYFPANHTWLTVQQDISGAFGDVLFKILEETTEYRFSFYRNATFITTTSNIKFKCTSSLCSVTYNLLETTTTGTTDIFSYSYNNDTKILNVVWNDGTGATTQVRTLVVKNTLTGQQTIVDNTVYSSTGNVNYDLTGYTGEVSLKIYQNSGLTPTINELFLIEGDAIYKFINITASGLWSFIIAAIFIGMGLLSPIALIIMGVVSVFIISILGINPIVDIGFIILVSIIAAVLGNKVE